MDYQNLTASMTNKIWTHVPFPSNLAERIICFPHAGSGASSFFPWAKILKGFLFEVAAVQYPGRENRILEKHPESIRELSTAIVEAWPEISGGKRCALFGHSMGALIALEVAHLLCRTSAQPIKALVVSGALAPHLPFRYPAIGHLNDDEFLVAVQKRYGSLPADLLHEPEALSIVLDVLRKDMVLVERHRRMHLCPPPLPLPIAVFAANDDESTPEPDLGEWQKYSTHPVAFHLFTGGHFFHHREAVNVIQSVLSVISKVRRI